MCKRFLWHVWCVCREFRSLLMIQIKQLVSLALNLPVFNLLGCKVANNLVNVPVTMIIMMIVYCLPVWHIKFMNYASANIRRIANVCLALTRKILCNYARTYRQIECKCNFVYVRVPVCYSNHMRQQHFDAKSRTSQSSSQQTACWWCFALLNSLPPWQTDSRVKWRVSGWLLCMFPPAFWRAH